MHNVKLHSRNSVPLPMARVILEQYLWARREGLSVVHSKRWGIYAAEAIRFGGYMDPDRLKSKNREKTVWWNGTSKHAKTETFDRIMKNTLGTTRFTGRPKTVDDWMLSALKRHDETLYADLKLAAKNYKNIVGRSPSPVDPKFLKTYRKWLKIRRGRNLFVRGFGKFDISAAMNKLKEDGYGGAILKPITITAAGYGMNWWRFQLLVKIPVLRRYYVKYKSFWSENENRLDELGTTLAMQWIQDDPDIPPRTLLRRLEAERERQRLEADRVRQQLGYDPIYSTEPFTHLATAPEIETPHGVLRPIKNPQELMEVGKVMKNCAMNYTPLIRNKSTLLLALFDQNGRPIALGEVRYDTEAKRWTWGQRLGPQNKNLAENIREIFQNYPLAAGGVWENSQELIED